MKLTKTISIRRCAIILGLLHLLSPGWLYAQGTAFTYQGRLNNGTNLATGLYDLRFTLYTTTNGGSPFGGPLTISAVPVSNGLFAATLDFGSSVFNGAPYWLELGVATNASGVFDTLIPRQLLTPSPYAEYATAAATAASASSVAATNIAGSLPDAQLSANVALRAGGNAFSGNQVVTSGNVGIGSANPANLLVVGSGVSPAYCDGTTWVNGSDRNSKEGFAAISPRAILEKVAALPITQWKYKMEAGGTRHVGPVAQDFHEAFGLNGLDDTHIATVDEGGVALAAIQGLNQKLEQRDEEIRDLKLRLEKLERLLNDRPVGGAR